MEINEFLSKLVDDDCIVENFTFYENKTKIINIISNIDSKLAIAVSSSFFNENINIFSNVSDINCIQYVISLPIFKESANLILIVFNPFKKSDEFILIDESDSLIHNNDDDWSYIGEELANDISNSIYNYEQSENALCLKINTVFKAKNSPQVVFKNTLNFKDEYDDILALKEEYNMSDKYMKRKVMSEQVQDDILALKSDNNKIIASKKKIISNDIVDEILNLKEEKSVRQQITKKNAVSIDEVSVDEMSANLISELMYSKKRQDLENMLMKNNKPLIDGDVEFRRLGKIADLHNIDDKNSKDTILIATCKQCSNKWVYYNYDVDDFNGEIFVEIDNVDDGILKEYLYEYLNSGNGMDELFYFSKGYNYIRAEFIKSVKIPIPSIEIQKEIVKASREAREFFKTVDLLKKEFNSNILDYKHISESINELKGDIEFKSGTCEIMTLSRSWRHAYQGLIWPLAISYLSATKGGFESVEKKDNYLILFEFIAAFNCIILLSGLPDDVYQKNFNRIWDAGLNEYKSMTFGNWVYVSKNLAEVYKNNNFTSKLDEELFEIISSDKILNILEIAKDLRNKKSHGSHSNAYEAKAIIEKLDVYLEDIFDILEIYSNYKLIYVTGDLKSTKQAYNHRVILLNGPCAQPIYDNIIFDNVLLSESLYLYNPKNNKKLLIKDNLMKFKPVDINKKRWALFLYSSCDKKEYNAYYKCFQSEEENIKISISSFKRDVLD